MPRHRGSRNWIVGKLGSFVNEFTVKRLADEADIDSAQVYRWLRGDTIPPVQKAIAISEIARSSGTNLSLEDIYESDVTRVRRRMHSSLPPL